MEQQLKHIAEGRATHDLSIVYSDMHGLWGGVTVTLSAAGDYERLERGRAMRAPDLVQATVTQAQVQDVVRMLIELEAWEQRTPARMPVPDEVAATLVLRSGDAVSSIWEWYNDLGKNDRLVRVRNLLVDLVKA